MQKVINTLALISFATSTAIVGAGAYVYVNKEAYIEQAKEQVASVIADSIGGGLGAALLSAPADPVAGMDESGAVPIPSIPFGG